MRWFLIFGIPFAAANNVALNKPASELKTLGASASRAVDGNINTDYYQGGCSYSRGWWGVDLQAVYNISHVVITRRTGFDLNNLHIMAYMTSPLCASATKTICGYRGAEFPAVFNQTCQEGTTGRYLLIEKSSMSSSFILCEVEVFGTNGVIGDTGVISNNDCRGPRTFVKQEGVKVEGESLIQGNATTRIGCSMECEANPLCWAFSFNPSLAECVQSGGLNTATESDGWLTYQEC